jgi:RecB family endonuclease NucS
LRDFIAQNLSKLSIDGKRLELFVDQAGRDGVEYPSAVGPIDILSRDDEGSFLVFELKRARSPDHAIGQLARYMGWVKETIGRGHEVRGIIVAKTISENLRYSIIAVPNVSLYEYDVEFHLKSVDSIG